MGLTLSDVIHDFDKHESSLNEDEKSELLNELREFDLKTIDLDANPQVIQNVIKFLGTFETSVVKVVISEMIKSHVSSTLVVHEPYRTIAKHFSPIIQQIKDDIENMM